MAKYDKKYQQSLGEMISSVTFVAMGIYFLLIGFGFWYDADIWRAIGVWFCSAVMVAAGFRFTLARWYYFLRRS